MRLEKHIDISDSGANALDVLATNTPLSRQKLKDAMQKGAVWLSSTSGRRGQSPKRLRRVKRKLCAGDQLHLYYDEHILQSKVPEPLLLADEGVFTVWYKPPGMLSQGSRWSDHCTLGRWVEMNTDKANCFVVHRLDRAASGIMLLAHQKNAAADLSALFQQRGIQKFYEAWVGGRFAPDEEALILDSDIDGRSARSSARCLRYCAERDQSLLLVEIETGRKHQIRQHLAQAGFPIVGDRLYAGPVSDQPLQLTAIRIAFTSPFDGVHKIYECPPELRCR